MTWNADGESSKGRGYVLAAPLPADVFKDQNLINDRKPFIVTSDYIGPDRRRYGAAGATFR